MRQCRTTSINSEITVFKDIVRFGLLKIIRTAIFGLIVKTRASNWSYTVFNRVYDALK